VKGHLDTSSAESEFGRYAAPLIQEAIAQASALEHDRDAEVLHKLRVALRKLRTLLWAYRPLLDTDFDDQQRAIYKQLADTAGDTRNWDILSALLLALDESRLAQELCKMREKASARSRAMLSHARVKERLRGAMKEAGRELSVAENHTPLKKFAWKRLDAAEKQLNKRMKRAAASPSSDYAYFHEVRKASKKVRYLLEFFEPLIDKRRRKYIKRLKTLQKRFGALNDVVASLELLQSNGKTLRDKRAVRQAIKRLGKEQRRRAKAAVRLL
jgi:CHAD domain-containing protein